MPRDIPTPCGVPAPNNGFGLVPQAVDVSGQDLARAPRFTTTFDFKYNMPMGNSRLELGGNVYYTSRYFLDTPSEIRQAAYAIVNMRATYYLPGDPRIIGTTVSLKF